MKKRFIVLASPTFEKAKVTIRECNNFEAVVQVFTNAEYYPIEIGYC